MSSSERPLEPYSWMILLSLMRSGVRLLQSTMNSTCSSNPVEAYDYMAAVGQQLKEVTVIYDLTQKKNFAHAQEYLNAKDSPDK